MRHYLALSNPLWLTGGALALATVVQSLLTPLWGSNYTYITYYPAIMFATLVAGWKFGCLATCAAAVLTPALFLSISDFQQGSSLIFFLGINLLLITQCELIQHAKRQVDETLRLSEEGLRAMLTQAAVGIAMVDRSGRLLEVNERLCSIVGRSRGELLQLTCENLTHPDDWQRNVGMIEQVLDRQRLEFAAEERYAKPDGTWIWVHVTVSPIRSEKGTIDRLMAVVEDIADRKHAQDALRESEERFSQFMQYLPGLAWIKDTAGRYVFVNDAAERAFGKPRAQLFGKVDEEVFPLDIARQFRDNDNRVLRTGSSVEAIETLEHEDGLHYSLVNKFPIPTAKNGAMMIGGIAIDVTQQRRAEAALRESEERLAGIVTTAMDAIISIDGQQMITLFNRAAEHMFGCPASHAIGHPLEQFIPVQHRGMDPESMPNFGLTHVAVDRMGHFGTIYGRRANGEEFPLEASLSQLDVNGARCTPSFCVTSPTQAS